MASMGGDDEDVELEETMRYAVAASGGGAIESLPPELRASLEITRGANRGVVFEITKNPSIIGRGRFADVRLRDASLSRLHAMVTFQTNEFRIVDNGSENGTFLNGSKVKDYRLRDNDKVLVGETLLTFRLARTSRAPSSGV